MTELLFEMEDVLGVIFHVGGAFDQSHPSSLGCDICHTDLAELQRRFKADYLTCCLSGFFRDAARWVYAHALEMAS